VHTKLNIDGSTLYTVHVHEYEIVLSTTMGIQLVMKCSPTNSIL
jgi:hypothetical protein